MGVMQVELVMRLSPDSNRSKVNYAKEKHCAIRTPAHIPGALLLLHIASRVAKCIIYICNSSF